MDGAKLVWLPTIDAKNESDHIMANAAQAADKTKMPFFAKFRVELAEKGKLQPPISIIESGKLTQRMQEVLDVVCERNIALATAHVSVEEAFVLPRECKQRGYRKLIVTIRTSRPPAFQGPEKSCGHGAIMEQCFTTPTQGRSRGSSVR